MIDFRYHLVSLISVFLALAVGVVLGAGPLQNSLGTALNDQVTSLRENRKAMQAQLEQTEAAVNDRDAYITAAAATYLPGTLDGRKVALAVLPDAESDDVDAITAQVETAGGTINGRVSLTTAWTDDSREAFRQTYSGQFAGYLGKTVSTDGNGVLGEGLGTALTSDSESAKALMGLLTASDTPLVTVDARPNGPADMIVAVGPRSADASETRADAEASATMSQTATSWASALTGTAAVSTTVVVGAADAETDVVSSLRTAKAPVTTIDSVGQTAAAVSTPLALAAAAAGRKGHYGFDKGADAVMPPIPS
ncbi:copper transporter [Actinomyces gerencseriae]|uniref:copper transporter n=1 Tax=Actinomyces gerencseriae TaxID=52769 RepID=UPI0023F12C2F|nr:copper transporter [Actinomyces gerencseriae]